MYDVITIGAATQDVFLQSKGFHLLHSPRLKRTCECFPLGEKINVERIDFATGGGATNAAATFCNLGFKTTAVAKAGYDSSGDAVREDLRARRIPVSWVARAKKGTTGYSAILLTAHGDRTALIHRGVSAQIGAGDIPWKNLSARWIFVTSLAGNMKLLKRLFTAACARGFRIAFNPGMQELRRGLADMRAHCGAAHVLFLNRQEASVLAGGGRGIRRLRRAPHPHFQNAVVVTDGKKGAWYWDEARFLFARALRVNVVNSTGAGDAFDSGFISGILRWRDPVRALQLATLNAAGTIQCMGAKRGLLTRMPSRKELQHVNVTRL